jgi:hypothetical protein
MKTLCTFILLISIYLSELLYSQTYSEIDYGAGTQIEVQAGADVCATNIVVNGSLSGGGTFCTGPLPVMLSEFSASVNKNNVTLVWKTLAELNNSGFDIERKTTETAGEWKKTAFVPGNGTTSDPKTYTWEDKKIHTGTYKYRLKQIDYNGNFEYFSLQSDVVISRPTGFSLSHSNHQIKITEL